MNIQKLRNFQTRFRSLLRKYEQFSETMQLTCSAQCLEFKDSLHVVAVGSVSQSCLTLCDPMGRSTAGFPVLHHLLEFVQTPAPWASDAIQPSHSLSPPSPLPSIFPSIKHMLPIIITTSWRKHCSYLLKYQKSKSRNMQGNVNSKSEFNPGGTCNGNKAADSADGEATLGQAGRGPRYRLFVFITFT